jgi:uncharacterized protein (DUF1697 family)
MSNPWIVLLGSVNVGRSNRVGNPDLKKALEQMGFPHARPVMQSGNLIIGNAGASSDRELEEVVEQGLEETLGLETHAFAGNAAALGEHAADPPWAAPPARVHLFVHKRPLDEQALDRLTRAMKDSEEISLADDHFWLHVPDGLARSRIVARAPALSGSRRRPAV